MSYTIGWGMEQRWRYRYFLQSILAFPVEPYPVGPFPAVTCLVDSFQDVPWEAGVYSYYWGLAASSSHCLVVATFEIAVVVGIAVRHRVGAVPVEMTHREEAVVVAESLPVVVVGSSFDWVEELDWGLEDLLADWRVALLERVGLRS